MNTSKLLLFFFESAICASAISTDVVGNEADQADLMDRTIWNKNKKLVRNRDVNQIVSQAYTNGLVQRRIKSEANPYFGMRDIFDDTSQRLIDSKPHNAETDDIVIDHVPQGPQPAPIFKIDDLRQHIRRTAEMAQWAYFPIKHHNGSEGANSPGATLLRDQENVRVLYHNPSKGWQLIVAGPDANGVVEFAVRGSLPPNPMKGENMQNWGHNGRIVAVPLLTAAVTKPVDEGSYADGRTPARRVKEFEGQKQGRAVLVHEGFMLGMLEVMPSVLKHLREHAGKVTLVRWSGHSLGAAVATLSLTATVLRASEAGLPSNTKYALGVYGCPKVGTQDFADFYQSLGLDQVTTRMENVGDLVPTIPPGFVRAQNDPDWGLASAFWYGTAGLLSRAIVPAFIGYQAMKSDFVKNHVNNAQELFMKEQSMWDRWTGKPRETWLDEKVTTWGQHAGSVLGLNGVAFMHGVAFTAGSIVDATWTKAVHPGGKLLLPYNGLSKRLQNTLSEAEINYNPGTPHKMSWYLAYAYSMADEASINGEMTMGRLTDDQFFSHLVAASNILSNEKTFAVDTMAPNTHIAHSVFKSFNDLDISVCGHALAASFVTSVVLPHAGAGIDMALELATGVLVSPMVANIYRWLKNKKALDPVVDALNGKLDEQYGKIMGSFDQIHSKLDVIHADLINKLDKLEGSIKGFVKLHTVQRQADKLRTEAKTMAEWSKCYIDVLFGKEASTPQVSTGFSVVTQDAELITEQDKVRPMYDPKADKTDQLKSIKQQMHLALSPIFRHYKQVFTDWEESWIEAQKEIFKKPEKEENHEDQAKMKMNNWKEDSFRVLEVLVQAQESILHALQLMELTDMYDKKFLFEYPADLQRILIVLRNHAKTKRLIEEESMFNVLKRADAMLTQKEVESFQDFVLSMRADVSQDQPNSATPQKWYVKGLYKFKDVSANKEHLLKLDRDLKNAEEVQTAILEELRVDEAGWFTSPSEEDLKKKAKRLQEELFIPVTGNADKLELELSSASQSPESHLRIDILNQMIKKRGQQLLDMEHANDIKPDDIQEARDALACDLPTILAHIKPEDLGQVDSNGDTVFHVIARLPGVIGQFLPLITVNYHELTMQDNAAQGACFTQTQVNMLRTSAFALKNNRGRTPMEEAVFHFRHDLIQVGLFAKSNKVGGGDWMDWSTQIEFVLKMIERNGKLRMSDVQVKDEIYIKAKDNADFRRCRIHDKGSGTVNVMFDDDSLAIEGNHAASKYKKEHTFSEAEWEHLEFGARVRPDIGTNEWQLMFDSMLGLLVPKMANIPRSDVGDLEPAGPYLFMNPLRLESVFTKDTLSLVHLVTATSKNEAIRNLRTRLAANDEFKKVIVELDLANAEQIQKESQSAFTQAVQSNNMKAVIKLMDSAGRGDWQWAEQEESLLSYTIKHGLADMVQLLLSYSTSEKAQRQARHLKASHPEYIDKIEKFQSALVGKIDGAQKLIVDLVDEVMSQLRIDNHGTVADKDATSQYYKIGFGQYSFAESLISIASSFRKYDHDLNMQFDVSNFREPLWNMLLPNLQTKSDRLDQPQIGEFDYAPIPRDLKLIDDSYAFADLLLRRDKTDSTAPNADGFLIVERDGQFAQIKVKRTEEVKATHESKFNYVLLGAQPAGSTDLPDLSKVQSVRGFWCDSRVIQLLTLLTPRKIDDREMDQAFQLSYFTSKTIGWHEASQVKTCENKGCHHSVETNWLVSKFSSEKRGSNCASCGKVFCNAHIHKAEKIKNKLEKKKVGHLAKEGILKDLKIGGAMFVDSSGDITQENICSECLAHRSYIEKSMIDHIDQADTQALQNIALFYSQMHSNTKH